MYLIEELYMYVKDLFVTLLLPTHKITTNLVRFSKILKMLINQRKPVIELKCKNVYKSKTDYTNYNGSVEKYRNTNVFKHWYFYLLLTAKFLLIRS